MNTNIIGRPARRILCVVLLGTTAAIGLTACQTATATAPAAPAQVEPAGPRPADRGLIEKYGGRPVDRVAEEIERAIQDGQPPSHTCRSHHVVEHPAGGYHFVCVQVHG